MMSPVRACMGSTFRYTAGLCRCKPIPLQQIQDISTQVDPTYLARPVASKKCAPIHDTGTTLQSQEQGEGGSCHSMSAFPLT